MLRYSLAITYYPRASETWRKSLDSLLAATSGEAVDIAFFPDGGHDIDYHFFPSFPTDGTRLGAMPNFNRALSWLGTSDADVVAVLPDDLIYAKGFLSKIERCLKDNSVGYAAAYTPMLLGKRNRFKAGWNEIAGGYYSSYGGAYFIPREIVPLVVGHEFYLSHLATNPKNIDHCIPETFHRLGLRQMFHGPSLVDHIGYTSTLGHKHSPNERAFK